MESEPSSDVKIFFKDKQNELKGPYTEREVQEWYREKWFDSSFPFYFMTGDKRPTEQTEFLTLDTLCTLNGIGCPFAPSKPESINEKNNEKILELEKELADLSKKCDGVKELEKRLEDVEKRLKELSMQPPPTSSSSDAVVVAVHPPQPVEKTTEPKEKAVAEVKTEAVPVQKPKQTDQQIGNAVAAYVLDALAVYASGDYDSWEKERTEIIESSLATVKSKEAKKVCERILVERMKEKDFFCCDLCQEALFNHKQALIHFTSSDHIEKETAEVGKSGVAQFRRVLDSFTKLPSELAEADEKRVLAQFNKHGIFVPRETLRPRGPFVEKLHMTYAQSIFADSVPRSDELGKPRYMMIASTMLTSTTVTVGKAKAAVGRKAFAELHKHLGTATTFCTFCGCMTGDREEFYAHLISSAHMAMLGMDPNRFDLLTMLVNMHRKDLI